MSDIDNDDEIDDNDDTQQFFFRAVPAAYVSIKAIIARLSLDKGVRYVGKKPTQMSVMNAILLWLDSRPAAEQRALIADGMERLNRIRLDGGTPAAATPGAIDMIVPQSDSGPEYPKRGGKTKRGA